MTQPSLFVEVHILQSLPPSNINRDDSGTRKQALYGGARRARVSSEAWKCATRMEFAKGEAVADRATRTKRIAALLAERLARPTAVRAWKLPTRTGWPRPRWSRSASPSPPRRRNSPPTCPGLETFRQDQRA
ncbi:type I-E CRISPR-associated protein Cas7/Cse4/CasC [Streptomyces sp. R35]|uniref:Type I-E CRISPR-associated protein Cas7/Cse4/CasC n=1 Tax=Streptomyces sp. R35 TaxID=3238630 RepID=A0AB39RY78_9ACTN